MAVAWPEPQPLERMLAWAVGLERFGIAGYGWGVAWLDGPGKLRWYRDNHPLYADIASREELQGTTSRLFLIHLRRPSFLSTVRLSDSQPFVTGPAGFAFCHNGYLHRFRELRGRFEHVLEGEADSEVGFRLTESLIREGRGPFEAIAEAHQILGGVANIGYLAADGTLGVYAGHPENRVWTFDNEGARVTATALHSMDTSLFNLVFTGATNRQVCELGGVAEISSAAHSGTDG
jgi:predicted glutamine amidotransferase